MNQTAAVNTMQPIKYHTITDRAFVSQSKNPISHQ